jgi:aminocarboxymuconate-semialdehyde decarboxylase
MRIDAFNHILPRDFYVRIQACVRDPAAVAYLEGVPTLWDLEARLRMLDEFEDYQQVVCLGQPTIESLGDARSTPQLARRANDGMAEICRKHPDRFPAFVASLPMNAPDAAVAEADRAVRELGARGVQVFTNVLGVPLAAPQFRAVFGVMAAQDLPIWVHPIRGPEHADYASETRSEAEVWFTFGWPYETSACMARLIFSGLFDELPGIKIITHHMGGMVPYFAGKIALGREQIFHGELDRDPHAERCGLRRQPIDYYRLFYADTATNGSAAAARCGHAFFGTEHCLFGTDAPFDPQGGRYLIRATSEAIDALEISAAERACIYERNVRALLRLDRVAGR